MMKRVVVTGIGAVSPNGVGRQCFEEGLRLGRSGVRACQEMATANFSSQVAGVPPVEDSLIESTIPAIVLRNMNSAMIFSSLASIECWRDARLDWKYAPGAPVDWETGALIGTGGGGVETISELVPLVDAGHVRRLGSSVPERSMSSNVSACVGGLLGLGGPVSTNSSACATGAEAVYNAFLHLREGRGKRMLAGGAEGTCHYAWSGFDAMRVLARHHNSFPERASRPLSASASGFVPASGAAVMMLETLESAQHRDAHIYAEILGGHTNCGGQRNGGSITASNPEGVRRCARTAVENAGIDPSSIDYINGHLTGTIGDAREICSLMSALEFSPDRFPYINATKSMIGHALGASGALETAATILQVAHGFIHPSINCEDLHPAVECIRRSIPFTEIQMPVRTALKVSFGFGDVNTCLVIREFAPREL